MVVVFGGDEGLCCFDGVEWCCLVVLVVVNACFWWIFLLLNVTGVVCSC